MSDCGNGGPGCRLYNNLVSGARGVDACTHKGGCYLGVVESSRPIYRIIALGRWKRVTVCEGFEPGWYSRICREAVTYKASQK